MPQTFMRTIAHALVRLYQLPGRWYLRPLLALEVHGHPNRQINERPLELSFALGCLARICPQSVLDVGSGTSAWPHVMAYCGFRVTAIDKIRGYWTGGFFNRHYHIVNDDITQPRISRQFDFITCISVLEHIPDHTTAVRNMFGLLNPGGHLLLTFPYNEQRYVEDVYTLPDADGHPRPGRQYVCHAYSRREIDTWLEENPGRIVEQEYYEVFTGDLWNFGERVYPPRRVSRGERSHLTCLLIQKA